MIPSSLDDKFFADLRKKLARMYDDDIAQDAIAATWARGDSVQNFEHYATRAAHRFFLMQCRRPQIMRPLPDRPKFAIQPEQQRRLEAREALRAADPRLVDAVMQGRALTPTERTLRHRMKKQAGVAALLVLAGSLELATFVLIT